MSTPKVTVHRSVLAQTLIPGLPGGSLGELASSETFFYREAEFERGTDLARDRGLAVDFGAFQHVEGQAVVGVFRNHGTEPAFEIPSYPEDEVSVGLSYNLKQLS
jgi:hypothetical protein